MARAAKILVILMVSAGIQTASAYNVTLVYFDWNFPSPLKPDSSCKFTYIIQLEPAYYMTCYYDLDIYLSTDMTLDGSDTYLMTYTQQMFANVTYIFTSGLMAPGDAGVQDWPLPHPNGWYYVIMELKPGDWAPLDFDTSDNVYAYGEPLGFQIWVDSGTSSTYTISGHVRDSTGQGMQDVTLSGLPGPPVTNSQGFYTGTVDYGFTAVVTPAANNLTFVPSSRSYSNVTQDFLTDDYAAQLIQCKISGRVCFPSGKPVEGVTIEFDDGAVSSVITDPNGYYGHYVASGWSGSIQPAKDTYTFSPDSNDLTDVRLNTQVNFVADRAGIFYVDPNAPGNNDGSSWPNAFTCLQEALAEASADNDIYVACGTYRPDEGSLNTPGDNYATFQLVAGAGLYGGFPNGGGDWNQREPSAHRTVLSGHVSGGQAFHVVTGADGAILDGFVIRDGNAGLSGADGQGGGMYIHNVDLTVKNCVFRNNYANEFAGAVYVLADSPDDSILFLDNCILENNISRDGGGAIYSKYSVVEIVNCTIANNASLSSLNGGGVFGSYSSVSVLNSILWGNTASGSSSLQAQIYSAPQNAAVDYSCVQNLDAAVGTGNIESDPNFVNTDGADYHLNIGSPCINRGSPDADYTDQYDIDGDRRLRYGRADMGADEVVGIDGDLQPDGVVNMDDFGIVASFWNKTCSAPDWCNDCDMNQNERVDLADAVVVMEQWLGSLSESDVNSISLIGHWALDENADSTTVSDSSGSGNDGTSRLNTSVLHTDGIVDGALEFNGDDYVRIPGFSELNGSSSATIAFAAKQYENSQYDYALWADGNVLIEFGYLGNTDLRIRWNLDGTWGNSHIVQDVLDTDMWHHWAFTFDQGATKIYRDGVEIYTGSDSQTSISTLSPLYNFGYRGGVGGFNGAIDEVRIYDEVLTANQVSKIAGIIPEQIGLIVHWSLNDNADNTTVADGSGYGNDGTTNVNTSVLHTDGIVDGALEFGGNDYIRVPDFSGLSGSSSATIAFAAKQYENSQYDYALWADNNVLIEFGSSGNTDLRIRWNLDGTWGNSHIVQDVLDTGMWHHWAFAFDQGVTKIYRDGVEIFTGSDSKTTISTLSPLYNFGYRGGVGGFNGVIDEVRIYNRALSEAEIQYLYENP